MLQVTDADYVDAYQIRVRFSNGREGVVDLEDSLWGPVFEPLKDVSEFRKFHVSSLMHTVCWENANFAPEYLYEKLFGSAGSAHPIAADSELLHVTDAKYVGDYRVWLSFSDGTSGEVDLSTALWGPVFEPLKDHALFGQVKFDPEMDTIVWPNGADLAPEYLKELVVQQSAATAKAS